LEDLGFKIFLLFAAKKSTWGEKSVFCVQNFITHNGARRSERRREREKVYSLILFFFFLLSAFSFSLSLSLFCSHFLFSFEF